MGSYDCDFWIHDDEGVEHVHGNHWHIFVSDSEEFFVNTLSDAVQSGQVFGRIPDAPTTNDHPRGLCLRYAMGDGDFISLIERLEDQNQFASAWPHIGDVGRCTLTLKKGFLWPNRLEAQLQATFGRSNITFFDNRFLENGTSYKAGLTADFHLAIHAYMIEKPDPGPIVIDNPESIRRFEPDRDPDDLSPLEFHTTGMAAFFQLKSTDRDDCEFRGPVKAVRELPHGAFGGRAWVLTVTVLRAPDAEPEDIDLDVVVSQHVLGAQPLPQVGEDVQGTGWVQGWLAGDDTPV